MCISATLKGGLGNQMFIIASTYSLALDNHDECAFNLNGSVKGQGNSAFSYKNNVFRKVKELPISWKNKADFHETNYNYKPIPYRRNMLLDGYFSSDKYFNHHRKEILSLFKDPDSINAIKSRFNFTNSVSLHVRRGDYLQFPTIHPVLDISYYKSAIAFMDDLVNIDRIYVVSDDINYCKGYMKLKDKRFIYIEGLADYQDMYLQSLCTHNIMANSSFSWWGSYLNENESKIIFAPKRWHGPGLKAVSSGLFCDNWITS